MPAFFCGIFGHKPSTGLVSNEGQVRIKILNCLVETRDRFYKRLKISPKFERERGRRFAVSIL